METVRVRCAGDEDDFDDGDEGEGETRDESTSTLPSERRGDPCTSMESKEKGGLGGTWEKGRHDGAIVSSRRVKSISVDVLYCLWKLRRICVTVFRDSLSDLE